MKIEQIIVHYLLKNKELSLQGIGTFYLDTAIPDSSDSDKPVIIPENAVSFKYDPKVKEDEGLINYIVEHTSKIKSLASSDLDSFLSLGRQFLNIGKPFVLHNLGTLEKINSGELVFKGGQLIAQKIEHQQKIRTEDTEMTQEEEELFNDYQKERKSNNGSKVLLTIIGLLALGAIGWAVWHYGFNKKEDNTSINSTENIQPLTSDSANNHKQDTTNLAANPITDSTNTVLKNPADSFTFKVVVNEYYTPDAANARLRKLKSFNRRVIMYTNDSTIYKVAEPFTRPLEDTTKVMDSLKRYYSKIYLEK